MEALDIYETLSPDEKRGTVGIIEFIIKDRNGNIIDKIIDKNVIKIFAKEMLSHRLPSSEIWDSDANGGIGGYVPSGIDENEEFAARYILFGASFDEDGTPLGSNDTRYYTTDAVTGLSVPIRLTPAATDDGGLINAIPITEPDSPLKRIENISFNNTYQPTGSPLLDGDVRPINNILVVETVLKTDEYNGFTNTSGDFFTVTEVALAGGRRFEAVGQCGLDPKDLFLEGVSGGTDATNGEFETSIASIANGTNIVSIDALEPASSVALFKTGDQVRLVNRGGTQDSYTTLNQVNSHYLITGTSGGRDLELDRTPTDSSGAALTGDIGVFRDTLKIFSHRILSTPVQKSDSFEITVRWTIIFN